MAIIKKEENVAGRPTKQGQENLESYIKILTDTHNLTDGQKTYLQNLINDSALTDMHKLGFLYSTYKIYNMDSTNIYVSEGVKWKPTEEGQKKLKNKIEKLQKENKLIYSQKSYLDNLINLPDLTDNQKMTFFHSFCTRHDLDIPEPIENVAGRPRSKEGNVAGRPTEQGQKTLESCIKNLTDTHNLTDGQKTYLQNLINDGDLTDMQKLGSFYFFYRIHQKSQNLSIKKDSSFLQKFLKNFITSKKEKVKDAQKLTEVGEFKPTMKGQKKLKNLIEKLKANKQLIDSQKSYLDNLIKLSDLTDKQKMSFFSGFCKIHDLDMPYISRPIKQNDRPTITIQQNDKNVIIKAKQKKAANIKEAANIAAENDMDNNDFNNIELNKTENNHNDFN